MVGKRLYILNEMEMYKHFKETKTEVTICNGISDSVCF